MNKIYTILGNTILVLFTFVLFIGAVKNSGADIGSAILILIFAIVVGVISTYRNRRFFVWFILSCLISPLISIIALFIKKKGATPDELAEMSLEFVEKYDASPENCRYGSAEELYLKIHKNKKITEGEFKLAEKVLSMPRNNHDKEWGS